MKSQNILRHICEVHNIYFPCIIYFEPSLCHVGLTDGDPLLLPLPHTDIMLLNLFFPIIFPPQKLHILCSLYIVVFSVMKIISNGIIPINSNKEYFCLYLNRYYRCILAEISGSALFNPHRNDLNAVHIRYSGKESGRKPITGGASREASSFRLITHY